MGYPPAGATRGRLTITAWDRMRREMSEEYRVVSFDPYRMLYPLQDDYDDKYFPF